MKLGLPRLPVSLVLFHCLGFVVGSLSSESSHSSGSATSTTSEPSRSSSEEGSRELKLKKLEEKILNLMNLQDGDVNFDDSAKVDRYVESLKHNLVILLGDSGIYSSLRSKDENVKRKARNRILAAKSPEQFREDLLERYRKRRNHLRSKIRGCTAKEERLKSGIQEKESALESLKTLLDECKGKLRRYKKRGECEDKKSRGGYKDKIKKHTAKKKELESEIKEQQADLTESEALLRSRTKKLRKYEDGLQRCRGTKERCEKGSRPQFIEVLFGERSLPALSERYFSIKHRLSKRRTARDSSSGTSSDSLATRSNSTLKQAVRVKNCDYWEAIKKGILKLGLRRTSVGDMCWVNTKGDGNCGVYSFFAAAFHLLRLKDSEAHRLFFDLDGYRELKNNTHADIRFSITEEFSRMKKGLEKCKNMYEFTSKYPRTLARCVRCFTAKWILRRRDYARHAVVARWESLKKCLKFDEKGEYTPQSLKRGLDKLMESYFQESVPALAWFSDAEFKILACKLHVSIYIFDHCMPGISRLWSPEENRSGPVTAANAVYVVYVDQNHYTAICPASSI